MSVWSNGWRIEQNAQQGKEDGAQMGQWELQALKGELLQARKTFCEASLTYIGKEVKRSSRRQNSRLSPVPFSRNLLSDWPLLSFFQFIPINFSNWAYLYPEDGSRIILRSSGTYLLYFNIPQDDMDFGYPESLKCFHLCEFLMKNLMQS